MRAKLSKNSRRKLFNYLKNKYKSKNLIELSKKMEIPKGTLDNWRYDLNYHIPKEIIPNEMFQNHEIISQEEDNWGQIKGGKKTFDIIVEKYGKEEIRRRQIQGGINSKKKFDKIFILDIENPKFLEFYGILIGDGCISKYTCRNKKYYAINISGHLYHDNDFGIYCKKNIEELFDRKACISKRKKQNSFNLIFCHKSFFNAISTDLNFPIGKKKNLEIDKKIIDLGYDYVRHVIRGIFDTDGSFYFDKAQYGKPYPCISIQMKAPILIEQLYNILINQGFKVYRYIPENRAPRITLKGRKQLEKWMREIGSSNNKHLNKINDYLKGPGSSIG
jgi:hypothetical protein